VNRPRKPSWSRSAQYATSLVMLLAGFASPSVSTMCATKIKTNNPPTIRSRAASAEATLLRLARTDVRLVLMTESLPRLTPCVHGTHR
jgi:hypothetical protein